MKLIIVESPTKARTLSRFLGPDYQILASMGHIRDLPRKTLGVDVEHDFKPEYEIDSSKTKIINELKAAAKTAEQIIIATDPDREGEAIAYHISKILRYKDTKYPNIPISRISFHEITKTAITKALENPGTINMLLVNSQQARRILDRLVGYKLSPLLWRKVRRGLSAGRVQSPAVRLIVEREREIKAFVAMEYWKIEAELAKKINVGSTMNYDPVFESRVNKTNISSSSLSHDAINTKTLSNSLSSPLLSPLSSLSPGQNHFLALLIKINGQKALIKNKEQADKILLELNKSNYKISDIQKVEVRRFPYPPFITSTLQRAGSSLFHWSAKKTMMEAQHLYENGLITYHRTDSVNLAKEAVFQARAFIEKTYGKNYLPEAPKFYKSKSKLAQEAHEAIRPTSLKLPSTNYQVPNTRDEDRLYKLIFNRFLACQMKEEVLEKNVVEVISGNYLFQAVGQKQKFAGWKIIYQTSQEEEKILPELMIGEELQLIKIIPQQKFTEPPSRYSEGALIKALEEREIGRPSTYAPIISTIQLRQYVEKVEGLFQPTKVGEAVNDFIMKYFSNIVDYDFTARMEDNLDAIAHGTEDWVPVIKAFWEPFSQKLLEVQKTAQREKISVETTGEKCPLCKTGDQVVRVGRFGKFLSCSRFPECKWKAVYIEKLKGIKCLDCGGDVVIRKTKRGKRFYGCSNYPKCHWASWRKPR